MPTLELMADIEILKARIERLVDDLRSEWKLNHDERCTNMGDCGEVCSHPMPPSLVEANAQATQTSGRVPASGV